MANDKIIAGRVDKTNANEKSRKLMKRAFHLDEGTRSFNKAEGYMDKAEKLRIKLGSHAPKIARSLAKARSYANKAKNHRHNRDKYIDKEMVHRAKAGRYRDKMKNLLLQADRYTTKAGGYLCMCSFYLGKIAEVTAELEALDASASVSNISGNNHHTGAGPNSSATVARKPGVAVQHETIEGMGLGKVADKPSASGHEKPEDGKDKTQEKGKDKTSEIPALPGNSHAGGLPSTKPHLTIFSLFLLDVLQRIGNNDKSWPFWALVSRDVCPGYYGDEEPIHFGIIKHKVEANHYETDGMFWDDISTVLGDKYEGEGERYYADHADELDHYIEQYMKNSPEKV